MQVWVKYGDSLGKKLSLSLFVLAHMDLKRLPEGNRLKRWKPDGWCPSRCFWPCWDNGSYRWQSRKAEGSRWFFVWCLLPFAFSSCWPPCSWSATLRRSAGSRWWKGRRSLAAECLVAPSWAPSGSVATAGNSWPALWCWPTRRDLQRYGCQGIWRTSLALHIHHWCTGGGSVSPEVQDEFLGLPQCNMYIRLIGL